MSDITLEADVDLTNIKTEDLIKVLKFRKYKPEDLIVQEDEKELLFYYVELDVDIDKSDILDEFSTIELIEELQSSGDFRIEDYIDEPRQSHAYHDSEKLEYIKSILGLADWTDNIKVIEALIKIF